MRTGRRSSLAVPLVVCSLLLGGCAGLPDHGAGRVPATGSDFTKLPSAEIGRQAVVATTNARTVRLHIVVQKKHDVLLYDVRRTSNGTCYGTVTEHGDTASVIYTEDYTFVRARAAFWRSLRVPGISGRMVGAASKWARFPASPGIQVFCNVRTLLTEFELDRKAFSDLEVTRKHDSVSNAMVLTSRTERLTLVVQVAEPHYFEEIKIAEGTVRLSEYGEPASVTLPKAGQFVPFQDGGSTV